MRHTHILSFVHRSFPKHYRTQRRSQWILDSISVKYLRSEMKCRGPEAWLELVWVAPDVTIFTARKAPNHSPYTSPTVPYFFARIFAIYILLNNISISVYWWERTYWYDTQFSLDFLSVWISIKYARVWYLSKRVASKVLFPIERDN